MSTIQKYSRNPESDDLLFEISKGNVKGHFIINKFGENPTLGITDETIWDGGGLYSYLSSASKVTLSCADARDTDGGTGVCCVRISGIDENWDYVSEDINTNGQTPVESQHTYVRVFRMIARNAGSNGGAWDDIYIGTGTVTTGVPANIHAQIISPNGQTQMAMMSIPRGYTGHLFYAAGSVGLGKEYLASIWTRAYESNVWNKVGASVLVESPYSRNIRCPVPIPEKTDIEFRGKIDSTPAVFVTGHFDIVLYKFDDSVPDIIQ